MVPLSNLKSSGRQIHVFTSMIRSDRLRWNRSVRFHSCFRWTGCKSTCEPDRRPWPPGAGRRVQSWSCLSSLRRPCKDVTWSRYDAYHYLSGSARWPLECGPSGFREPGGFCSHGTENGVVKLYSSLSYFLSVSIEKWKTGFTVKPVWFMNRNMSWSQASAIDHRILRQHSFAAFR